MPFSIEEVEAALADKRSEINPFYYSNSDLLNSASYRGCLDYLTGKSQSLTPPASNLEAYCWGPVIKLLKNIENPSINDQLILDLIYDPAFHPVLMLNFNYWLKRYAFRNLTDNAFAAVYNHFKKQSLSDDHIFLILVGRTTSLEPSIEQLDGTKLKSFLINHLKGAKKIPVPSPGFSNWSSEWSSFFFLLIEESGNHLVNEYALLAVLSESKTGVQFLSAYKNGYYLQPLIQFIEQPTIANVANARHKFATAVSLFEHNEKKYQELIIRSSTNYLNDVRPFLQNAAYEGGLTLQSYNAEGPGYLPYSICAFHFLLTYERNAALVLLDDWIKKRDPLDPKILGLLQYHLKQEVLPYLILMLESEGCGGGIQAYHKIFELFRENFTFGQYADAVWKLVNNKSRPVRQLLAKLVIEKDLTFEDRAIPLLTSKSADTRQTAALILSASTSEKAKQAIYAVLDTETNDNARDILLEAMKSNLPSEASSGFITNMVEAANKRGKLKNPVESWLVEDQLPSLYFKAGNTVSDLEKRFLFYRMKRVKAMRSETEARFLLQEIDREKSAPFALALIQLFVDNGGAPDNKWMMALAALLGNDKVTEKIISISNQWIENGRYKMAEYGVAALALQGSDKALRAVEWYSRKYRNKKANVGAAALEALEAAAEELGISTQELGDRIVPDFGFEGLFKEFKIGGDGYRAFIDSKFKIAFFDDDNKKLKSIPSAADSAQKEEFKAISKEIRDIVKSQSPRLEYYLIIQRKWTYAQWQKFFLRNPVMFIYATKLIWGIYNEEGSLLQTFICNEDTSLLNVEQDEISLSGNEIIGIVYPSQLPANLISQWKQVLFDQSIEQVFPQLDRKSPDLSDIDKNATIINRYNGKQMLVGSTRSTLERFGWSKGLVGDGGMLESFNLAYREKKIEAILEVEGIGAGFGWGTEEKLGRLYIIDQSRKKSGWGNLIQNEKDESLVTIKNVPDIFLREILGAIETIRVQPKAEG